MSRKAQARPRSRSLSSGRSPTGCTPARRQPRTSTAQPRSSAWWSARAKALVGGTIEAFGTIDILINNAGMSAALPTLELGLDRWQKVVDLNMTSVFLCSREAARHMLESGGGSIINTASIMSFSSFPRRLAYGATKAAVVMMTRMLAAEWAPTIRVNAVAPGYTRTEMVEKLQAEGRIDLDAI